MILFTKSINKLYLKRNGFSLVEIIVALVILSVLIFPMHSMFVVSIKVQKSTERIFQETNLATSYMTAISGVPPEFLKPVSRTLINEIEGEMSLKNLDFSIVIKNTSCFLTIIKEIEDVSYSTYRVIVEVENNKSELPGYKLTSLLIKGMD